MAPSNKTPLTPAKGASYLSFNPLHLILCFTNHSTYILYFSSISLLQNIHVLLLNIHVLIRNRHVLVLNMPALILNIHVLLLSTPFLCLNSPVPLPNTPFEELCNAFFITENEVFILFIIALSCENYKLGCKDKEYF
jgi:hypothetical protein